MRLATSIRTGTVTASLILGKLAAYPWRNVLAWANKEIGKIERTVFYLEWTKSPDLRQRVTGPVAKMKDMIFKTEQQRFLPPEGWLGGFSSNSGLR